MFSLRDVYVFIAGAGFFHTLSHILLGYFFQLPLQTKVMVLTPSLNFWIIIASAVFTIFFLWLAVRQPK